jgi:formylglycine-generating enzyme required for sulfatase activity
MFSTEVTNAQMVAALQWAYNQGYVTASASSVQDALDGSTEELLRLNSKISFSEGVFSTPNPDLPVSGVSWYGAVAYCDWKSMQESLPRSYDHSNWSCNNGDPYHATGYRLPTEAEWEFACRAGTTTHFNTGDCLDSATEANFSARLGGPFNDCPVGPTLDGLNFVGSYLANQWGLYDMHGNAYELCQDWAGDYSGDATNPVGPESGEGRIVRGGDWSFGMIICRSACRNSSSNSQDSIFGFRPVRSVH